jgi:putative DNA primase/helicase
MVNAHPVILSHYLTISGISHPQLRQYIDHREPYLKSMGDKDGMNLTRGDAKMKILAIINGGKISTEEEKKIPDNVRNFYNEILENRKKIMSLNTDLVAIAKRKLKASNRSDWNISGTVTNMVMCDYENRVLLTMFNFFKNRGYDPQVLVFDGIMIRKAEGKCMNQQLLDECSTYVLTELGIGVRLDIKPMDKHFLDIPEFLPKYTGAPTDKISEAFENIFSDNNDEDKLYTKCITGSHASYAELFQFIYGSNMYITSKKHQSFYHWNETTLLWESEDGETLLHLLKENLTTPFDDAIKVLNAIECDNPEEEKILHSKIKQLDKVVNNIGNTPFLNNVIKYYMSFSINKKFESEIINKKPHELPIQNGKIIDLRTLEVRLRTKDDFWSVECPVDFLGIDSDMSEVLEFMGSITCGSEALTDYHRRLWGYMLSGEISDRSLHIFWGNGCNGKSSIVNIFKQILGKDLSVSLSEDVMIKKKASRGASPELMSLMHSRCGILPESDKKEVLNSKRVKTITGDDSITARHLFGHLVEFKTQCKPILPTNHKPAIDIDDKAILDRVKLVPFLARFEKNSKNNDYIKNLQENKLNEFFTWFCTGARDWYAGEELIPCAEMSSEMDKYINEFDTVAEFIKDTYSVIEEDDYTLLPRLDKANNRVKKSRVFTDFMEWVVENRRQDDNPGKKLFYKAFTDKVGVKKINGTHYFLCKALENECENERDSGEGANNFGPPM